MKTLSKIILILVIATSIFAIIPQNTALATGAADVVDSVTPKAPGDEANALSGVVGKLLGFLQVASGLVAILMIAITGFNYIVGTPDVKDEMKKKMLPIIIGLILVFGAVTVAQFILGVVDQMAQ